MLISYSHPQTCYLVKFEHQRWTWVKRYNWYFKQYNCIFLSFTLSSELTKVILLIIVWTLEGYNVGNNQRSKDSMIICPTHTSLKDELSALKGTKVTRK